MKKFIPILISAAAVAFVSCTTVNTIEPAQSSGMRQMVNDKRVITDTSLNSKVNVVGLNVAATESGLLRLQVEILNRRSAIQTFYYKIDWFDMNGMLVETTSNGWREKEILGRETIDLTAIAPNANCKDFRIKFVENPR